MIWSILLYSNPSKRRTRVILVRKIIHKEDEICRVTTLPLTQFNFRILGVWNPISELGLLPKSPKEWILAKQRSPPLGQATCGLAPPSRGRAPPRRGCARPPPRGGAAWLAARGCAAPWLRLGGERERDWVWVGGEIKREREIGSRVQVREEFCLQGREFSDLNVRGVSFAKRPLTKPNYHQAKPSHVATWLNLKPNSS